MIVTTLHLIVIIKYITYLQKNNVDINCRMTHNINLGFNCK